MALTWTAKDPDAILDYSWTPPVDSGDSISTAALSVITGSVNIDSQVVVSGKLVAFLSGGVTGEVTAFAATCVTTGGRTFDETIYLPVQTSADPNVADLKRRYPAFAAVDDGTIAYWLKDAERYVGTDWVQGDYAPGLIAAAAHNMAKAPVAGIAGSDIAGFAAAGVTHFRSGSFQAQFSDEAIKVAVAGGWASTSYGQEYLDLLRRNVSSMGVTAPGHVPCGYGYNGFYGLVPPWVCG